MAVQSTSQARPSAVISLCPDRLSDCSAVMPDMASAPSSVMFSSLLLLRELKSKCVNPGYAKGNSGKAAFAF